MIAQNLKRALAGKTVLVVDDEFDLRAIIQEDLEAMGASVFSAENGKAAFTIAAREQPHAIISDIRMPGGDGIELFSQIKASDWALKPAFVFITGFSDLTPERAASIGETTMLAKPFNLRQLREALLNALQN